MNGNSRAAMNASRVETVQAQQEECDVDTECPFLFQRDTVSRLVEARNRATVAVEILTR